MEQQDLQSIKEKMLNAGKRILENRKSLGNDCDAIGQPVNIGDIVISIRLDREELDKTGFYVYYVTGRTKYEFKVMSFYGIPPHQYDQIREYKVFKKGVLKI